MKGTTRSRTRSTTGANAIAKLPARAEHPAEAGLHVESGFSRIQRAGRRVRLEPDSAHRADVLVDLLFEEVERQTAVPQHDVVEIADVELRPQRFLRPLTQLLNLQLPH